MGRIQKCAPNGTTKARGNQNTMLADQCGFCAFLLPMGGSCPHLQPTMANGRRLDEHSNTIRDLFSRPTRISSKNVARRCRACAAAQSLKPAAATTVYLNHRVKFRDS